MDKKRKQEILKTLTTEHSGIQSKIFGLQSFIYSPDFEVEVPEKEERRLLCEQLLNMNNYLRNLLDRIKYYRALPDEEQEHHCGQDATCHTASAEELYGRIVLEPGKCDDCPLHESDCKKVYVKGIGTLCLAKNLMEGHDIKTEKPVAGTYYVHQLWPNNHPFVFIAQYSEAEDKWRPWTDIDVAGLPLDDTQVQMITHWMPVLLPETNNNQPQNQIDNE